ncbi:hypothetical protein TNCV_4909881 [Trichonephila clavipes]|nr:hypothetical protein TNCV_4909881 [Trichonephila clavipes]
MLQTTWDGDHGSLVVKVIDSWLACHELSLVPLKTRLAGGSRCTLMSMSNVLPLVWWERLLFPNQKNMFGGDGIEPGQIPSPLGSLVLFCRRMSQRKSSRHPDIQETSETIIPEIEGKRSPGIGFHHSRSQLSLSLSARTHTQNR